MTSRVRLSRRSIWAAISLLVASTPARAQVVGLLPDTAIRRFYAERRDEYVAELHALTRTRRGSRRSGGTLRLLLGNSQYITYRDTIAEGDSHHRYVYLAYYPGPRLHVVEQSFYEGHLYIVINDRNGDEQVVSGPPVLSPNRKYFVSSSLDLVAGYDPNRIEVWSVPPLGLRHRFTWDGGVASGPDSVAWVGSDSIRFVRVTENQGSGETRREPAWIVRSGTTWRMSPRNR